VDVRRSEGRPRLTPGDVLLVHGDGAVSWAIRRFDEADVDHAAIVLDAETVADVSAVGPRERPWDQVVDEGRFAYVRRLPNDVDASPVVSRARSLLADGNRYVDRRLFPLAVLSMTRRLPLESASLRRVIRAVLDRGTELVDGVMADGRELLPSSHFVYRCFEESGDPRSSLSIMFPAVHPPAALLGTGTGSGESTLIEWAMARAEPVVVPRVSSVVRVADPELNASIAAFAIEESPQDPFAAQAPAAGSLASGEPVSDEELLVSAVRFRNQMNRFAVAPGPDPWITFRTTADLVTAGDLRYTPSLATIASVRPERRRAMIDG
jgi:hypothetical protein